MSITVRQQATKERRTNNPTQATARHDVMICVEMDDATI
jgi:hypothetical protein